MDLLEGPPVYYTQEKELLQSDSVINTGSHGKHCFCFKYTVVYHLVNKKKKQKQKQNTLLLILCLAFVLKGREAKFRSFYLWVLILRGILL